MGNLKRLLICYIRNLGYASGTNNSTSRDLFNSLVLCILAHANRYVFFIPSMPYRVFSIYILYLGFLPYNQVGKGVNMNRPVITGYTHKDWAENSAPLSSYTWIYEGSGQSKMPMLSSQEEAATRYGAKNIVQVKIQITTKDLSCQ